MGPALRHNVTAFCSKWALSRSGGRDIAMWQQCDLPRRHHRRAHRHVSLHPCCAVRAQPLRRFTGVSVTLPGTGYTLTATSAGLTAGVSTAFNITAPPLSLTLVSPAAVDAVFATVPIKLAGTNFLIGATTVSVTGGFITTANTVVQSSDTMTTNFIITGGAPTSLDSITATTPVGQSNIQLFNLYSVGNAPLQLGTANGEKEGRFTNSIAPRVRSPPA